MTAQWIWENPAAKNDEYADFTATFIAGKRTSLRISADSNYAVTLNGTLAAFGQYADFPHYKIYDEIDLSALCQPGENVLCITVWYYGAPSSVYCPGQAGVWFEVEADGEIVSASGAHTLCRKNPYYAAHREKIITGQMGFSFAYDANAVTDDWHVAHCTGFAEKLYPRPNKKLVLEPERVGTVIGGDGATHFLLDVGCEEVGFLALSLIAQKATHITIAYGEHIVDGFVRRRIGGRDFSVEYTAKPGENSYMNPFRRLGCRYLEIFADAPIQLCRAGIVPTVYPVVERPFTAPNARMQAIYDVCVRTLRLCMHEHYEDCPWREQALYAMDSRNQILAGYYAFGEYEFPRSCLSLMAQDRREDQLLSITTPCGSDLTIPSFSLHYFIEILEYTEYSGDLTLVRAVWEKLCSVLSAFTARMENGLISPFPGKNHWNFYEWTDGLSGNLGGEDGTTPDLILNCLAIRAIDAMSTLSERAGLTFDKGGVAEQMRAAVRRTFFLEEEGMYSDYAGSRHVSELGNALAILAGVSIGEETEALAAKLAGREGDMVRISLSMKCFLYDALLSVDRARYRNWVLTDIEAVYTPMLEAGATSVWETERGEADFSNAGSLCHGWSAMPVYYYWVL